jgi:hypothetical protein
MNSQSLTSISFVITATYTVTFGNTIYLMTVSDGSAPFSLNNMQWSTEKVICGTIALIMTLRFFFGNNQYIADVMLDQQRTPWVKFYQFFFIAIQSVVLLLCSYTIPQSTLFVNGITALFSIEVCWYLLTMIIDKKGVLPDDPRERWAFFYAELWNLAFVASVLISNLIFEEKDVWWLCVIFLSFLINSAIDAKKNMKAYMS